MSISAIRAIIKNFETPRALIFFLPPHTLRRLEMVAFCVHQIYN